MTIAGLAIKQNALIACLAIGIVDAFRRFDVFLYVVTELDAEIAFSAYKQRIGFPAPAGIVS